MVQIFRQMRFSCHFQNFAYFLAFSRYTFQNLNQRLHGICSQPLHDPWSTKKNNIITSSMKLLSIKYHFWSILAVFLWLFFIGPPKKKQTSVSLICWGPYESIDTTFIEESKIFFPSHKTEDFEALFLSSSRFATD